MSVPTAAADLTTVRVCRSYELLPGKPRRVEHGALAVALVNVDGAVHAVDDACLHRGGHLSDGYVRDGTLECPLHWWRYDLRTGERVGTPDLCLTIYATRVVDDWVEVDLPAPAPARTLREILLDHARAGRRP